MQLAIFFLLPLTESSPSVDLSFYPKWEGVKHSNRCKVDLVNNLSASMNDFVTEGRKGLTYEKSISPQGIADPRLYGWNILEGKYAFPPETTPAQRELILEWSRIVVVYQSSDHLASPAHTFYTRIANIPVWNARLSEMNLGAVDGLLMPAKLLNVELWRTLHSFAVQRLALQSNVKRKVKIPTEKKIKREKHYERIHEELETCPIKMEECEPDAWTVLDLDSMHREFCIDQISYHFQSEINFDMIDTNIVEEDLQQYFDSIDTWFQ